MSLSFVPAVRLVALALISVVVYYKLPANMMEQVLASSIVVWIVEHAELAFNYLCQLSFKTLVLLVVGLFLGPWLYDLFFCPLDYSVSLEEYSERLKKRGKSYVGKRLRGDTPPPYPNGWFRIFASHEVKKGEARYIFANGTHYCVYRGQNGVATVMNAYCPHLGANLGLEGQVVGNDIRCPFHGWKFDQEGRCVEVPYSDAAIPKACNAEIFHFMEANGAILVWFHADGLAPTWKPPTPPEIQTTGSWSSHGWTTHYITAHPQEMPENGADVAHLGVLHKGFFVETFFGLAFGHSWDASWTPGAEVPVLPGQEPTPPEYTQIDLTSAFTFLDHDIPGTKVNVSITQAGPGLVHLHFSLPVGCIVVIESVTPVGPLLIKANHSVFASPGVPRFLAKAILRSLVAQFERDVPIWNTKTFIRKAPLVKGDGPIMKYRRWYSQFYSEGSRRYAEGLDW